MEPYELAITIMIAELAAVPMQDRQIPLVNGFYFNYNTFFYPSLPLHP